MGSVPGSDLGPSGSRVLNIASSPLGAPSRYVAPIRLMYDIERAADAATSSTPAATSALPAPPTPAVIVMRREWHCIEPKDSVAVLVHRVDRGEYLLAKQFRPPILYARWRRLQRELGHDKAPSLQELAASGEGYSIELCGGLVDKELPLQRIAACEVEEELGYRVGADRLHRMFHVLEAVGVAGARLTAYYVQVTEADHLGPGGGLVAEGEAITTVALSDAPSAVAAFLSDESLVKSADLQLALTKRLLHGMAGIRCPDSRACSEVCGCAGQHKH